MNAVLETISQVGILPVIKINDSARAAGLGKALSAGGIPVAEITFRTEAAERSIYEIANQVPEVCVGAGTVLTVEQAKAAVAAGARFLVSPGFNPSVTGWCIENHVPIVPGCATPTEVEAAMGLGLRVLKFFPAEAAGGVAMLKSLASPYSSVRFIPTGGITP
ncbi:MAG: bifunctional 4-hydroxy-2-oxoglutarate aldolase/2-dehydro-3-deoxy-phosphogluconate aldolase, partial [Angelakisella sp.]